MLEKLRYLTAGESHGQALVCVMDGMPSNLSLPAGEIDKELSRRQQGYGRGGRMKIESDRVKILSGVRSGRTIGSPITLLIENKDWENWREIMSPELNRSECRDPRSGKVTRPRPGHADLAGAIKYNTHDIRNILERSSARETAARVAAGAVAKQLLSAFDIRIISYVTEIGGIRYKDTAHGAQSPEILSKLFDKAERSPVRCPDKDIEKKMMAKIDKAMKQGDTLGGIFQVGIFGVPAGLGSYCQWDRKLDARLAFAIMSIQAIKGVELGLGFDIAKVSGSAVMDEIYYRAKSKYSRKETCGGFFRKTNNAGGIEGGMSNGMPIIIRAAMKPIPTLRTPLSSVDIISKRTYQAAYERSDVCAVPAASVIGEAAVALVIADSFLSKFGGDSIEEVKRNYEGYLHQSAKF